MYASGSGRLARGTIIPFTYSLFNLNDHGLGEGGEEKGPSVSGMHATVKSDLEQLNGAVDRCCANVECAEREFSSRDLAVAALCLLRVDFLSARCPRRFFLTNALRLLLSSKCFLPKFLPSFFRRVGCGTPTTPRLLHRRHFCLLACALRAFFLSSLRAPRFPRRRCPNFATPGTVVAAGNDFTLLGCVAASRCCWQACSISIDEFSHQSM